MSIQRLKVRSVISLFMQVSGALCVSCIVLVFILQQDPWVKQQLTRLLLNSMHELVQVPVTGNVVAVDLVAGTLVFDNIVLSEKNQWSFSCARTVITFSWLDFLKHGYLLTDVTFYKPQIYSHIISNTTKDRTLSIAEPLLRIMQAPATVLPCVLRKCFLSQATAQVVTSDNAESLSCVFSSQVTLYRAVMRILCDYSQGTVVHAHEPILCNSSGTAVIDIDTHTQAIAKLTTHNQVTTCIAGKKQCYTLSGIYKNNKGYGELKALDQSIVCRLAHVTYTNATYRGILRAQADGVRLITCLYPQLFSYVPDIKNVQGNIQVRLALSYTPYTGELTYTGTLGSTNLRIANVGMPACISTVRGNNVGAQARFEIYSTSGKNTVQGNWKMQFWPFSCEIDACLTRATEVYKGLGLEQATGRCTLQYTSKNNTSKNSLSYKSNYMLSIVHKTAKTEKKYTVTGSCVGGGHKGMCKISVGSLEGKALYTIWPFTLEKLTLAPYIELMYNAHTGALETTLESNIIKQLIAHLGYELQGEGKIKLSLKKNNQVFMLTGILEQASMRLKGLYNMAKAGVINLEFDTVLKKILCKDSVLELHKGSVKLTQATVIFEGDTCVSAHVPLVFDNCLASWQKDFFGTFSGALVGVYTRDQEKSIKGFVTLDQSHLRSNLLSLQVQQQLLSGVRRPHGSFLGSFLEQVQLALTVCNNDPIHIKTSVLDSKARIALEVQGTLVSPEVSGIIELLQGTLLFAYKPLYITHARLYLTPGQLDNALVELTARNKIKKYTVTLQASGPVQQPIISIHASPSLQEEQIITLLLAGSEEGSLYAVVPAMIMHTLENFLFGAQQEPSQIQRSLKLLLQPLKHVRIRPDSNGPLGSFKGGVEIDLTDKLRASVQSKLYTPQDTQVEIEYTVSDDVSVKGLKDERGTLSGEIEMRWKF